MYTICDIQLLKQMLKCDHHVWYTSIWVCHMLTSHWVFSAIWTPHCKVMAWKFLALRQDLRVCGFQNLNFPSWTKTYLLLVTWFPVQYLSWVSCRHWSQQGGLVELSVYLQACYRLYFPEGEIKVSEVYWLAYSDSVSRKGIGSKTISLVSSPKRTTPYLAMPRLEAKGPSQRIWSENIWRVTLKPQKHWKSHKDV